MALRYKVFNSTQFSPNPWIPSSRSHYTPKPSKRAFVPQPDTEKLNRNMSRLCLLFPTIKVYHILKILTIHHFNITEAIDTLLHIKNIQTQNRHLRKDNNCRRQLEYIRTSTSARCIPFKSRQLIQSILEEDVEEEDRTIIPNITFGTNCTNALYEYDLNFNVHPVQNTPDINIAQPDLEVPVRNEEEILEVVDSVEPPPNRSTTNGNIKIRVHKQTSGMYAAQLLQ